MLYVYKEPVVSQCQPGILIFNFKGGLYMHKYFIACIFVVCLCGCHDRNMLYNNANAFVLKVDDNTYRVTASHVLTGDTKEEDYISARDDIWYEEYKSNDYYELSTQLLPIGFLKNESARKYYPLTMASIRGEVNGHLCGCLPISPNFMLILTTIPMQKGDSGSPLLDSDGKVLGVASLILDPRNSGNARSAFIRIDEGSF